MFYLQHVGSYFIHTFNHNEKEILYIIYYLSMFGFKNKIYAKINCIMSTFIK